MSAKIFLLIIIGLLLGILIHSQFMGYTKLSINSDRDTILSNLEQVNILASNNSDLTKEIDNLEKYLESIQQESENTQLMQNDILLYEKISGDQAVSGPGVSVTFTIPVDSYWVIDLINELNLAGAEAIAINEKRFTNYSYLLTNYNPDPEIIMNGTDTVTIPMTISAIGDTETLKTYIEQDTGTLQKLAHTYADFSNVYYITTSEILTLPGTTSE